MTAHVLLLLAALATAAGSEEGEQPLQLRDVLVSVERHFPLLRAAEQERAVAGGELLGSEGAFDLRLQGLGGAQPQGFYENYTGGVALEQPTTIWGSTFFGGYRVGRGDFPTYEGERATYGAGEVRGGFKLPLLRGGPIDSARARLEKASIDVDRAEPVILEQRIDFARQASFAYWRWVATGLLVGVAERLVTVAEDRQKQLEGRVARGALPTIDLADNERLIIDRQVKLLAARRDAEQAAITLSLFLRDPDGNPLRVSRRGLLKEFPLEEKPDPGRLDDEITRALERHPVVLSFSLLRSQQKVTVDLAENRLLPALDLRVEASQDFGEPTSLGDKGPADVKVLLAFELPLQRREARGDLAVATAKLSQIESKERFAKEKIAAEIRKALAGLEAAHAQLHRARENLTLALRLQKAEERKLDLGVSNLINVNIREVQAADAEATLIGSQAGYFLALAEYRAAIADNLDPDRQLLLSAHLRNDGGAPD